MAEQPNPAGQEVQGHLGARLWKRGRETLHNRIASPKIDTEITQEVKHKQKPGIYDQSGNLLIEIPNPKLISRITAADPRIEYFPSRIPGSVLKTIDLGDGLEPYEVRGEAIMPSPGTATILPDEYQNLTGVYEIMNRIGFGPNLFVHDLTLPFLTRHISDLFSENKIVGVRGTACSIDLDIPIQTGGKRIRNIVEIVNNGGETNTDSSRTGFRPNQDAEIGSRSIQWLIQHTEELREDLLDSDHPEQADNIFPVLLVYGPTLKAFVLDFPHKS